MNKKISRKWKRLERRKRYLEWKGSKAYAIVFAFPIFGWFLGAVVCLILFAIKGKDITNSLIMCCALGLYSYPLILLFRAFLPLQKKRYARIIRKRTFLTLAKKDGYRQIRVQPFRGISKEVMMEAGLLDANQSFVVKGQHRFRGTIQGTMAEASLVQIEKVEKVRKNIFSRNNIVQWAINGVFGILQTDVECPCEIRVISSDLRSNATFLKKTDMTDHIQPFQWCMQSDALEQMEIEAPEKQNSVLFYSDNGTAAKNFLTDRMVEQIRNITNQYDEVFLSFRGTKVYFYVNEGDLDMSYTPNYPEYMLSENTHLILNDVECMRNQLLEEEEEGIMYTTRSPETGIPENFVDSELQLLKAIMVRNEKR